MAFRPGAASIPFRFTLPADAQETTAEGNGEGILWVVTAEAALPGIDLKDDFDVAVRNAPGSELTAGAARTPPPAAPGTPVSLDELAAAGISVQHESGALAFRFAPMRNVSMAMGTTAFTAIWTGALWFQIHVGFPWIFPIVTGLFDLLLLAIVFDLWLGTTVMTVADCTARRRHGLVGFGRTRTIAGAEIARIELNISMQTSGRYGTPYYDVRAVLTNGRKASLADGIRSKRHAEWIAAELRARLL